MYRKQLITEIKYSITTNITALGTYLNNYLIGNKISVAIIPGLPYTYRDEEKYSIYVLYVFCKILDRQIFIITIL